MILKTHECFPARATDLKAHGITCTRADIQLSYMSLKIFYAGILLLLNQL